MKFHKKNNALIRDALARAAAIEAERAPFQLSGRGHEPRVTLDRKLAAILRNINLPRVYISGYGANFYYPRRIFTTARRMIGYGLEKPKIKFNQESTYLDISI